MKYDIVRTETADADIRKIILYIVQNFGLELFIFVDYAFLREEPWNSK